jgi:endonuclease YncB( thermonuclease family)
LFIFPAASASCPEVDWDETVVLKKINDGDTVTLDNNRLVRFIGINTPEINHRNISKSEPYALEAKALLERYIRPGDKIHLVYDKTKQDKYGRKLAYVYSKTGRDLGLLQLKAGFAHHWVIGKNDKFWRCFQDAQGQAKLRKKGVWSNFKPLSAKRLQKNNRGYAYISGRITSMEESRKGLKLMLDKHLSVWISSANLKRFTDSDSTFFLHNKLLLTGKLFFSKKQARLTLYHPAQILP